MKKRKLTIKKYLELQFVKDTEKFIDEQLAEYKIDASQLLDEIFNLCKEKMIGVSERKDDCILYYFIGDKFKITAEKLPEE